MKTRIGKSPPVAPSRGQKNYFFSRASRQTRGPRKTLANSPERDMK